MEQEPDIEEPMNDDDGDGDDEVMVEQPAFVSAEDAVEVQVDEDAPIDEDEDDAIEQEQQQQEEEEEMSTLQFNAHQGPVYAVAATPSSLDGRILIISGGGDDQAFVHTDDKTSIRLDHSHTDSVASIATCAEWIAVGSYDGTIVLYNKTSPAQPQKQLDGPTDIEWLSFHPTGTVLLAGSTDGTVWMYHVPSNQCLQVFVGHEAAVTAGTFLNKVAVTASADGTVRIWAPKTGLVKHVFRQTAAGGALTCLAVQQENLLVLVGAEDGCAYCYHVGSKKMVHRLQHSSLTAATAETQRNAVEAEGEEEELAPAISVEAVGFCTVQPHWCATAGVDGVLKVWDLNSGQCRHTCQADEGLTRLSWYNTNVVTASTSGTVRIWDARSGHLVSTFTTSSSAVINDMQLILDDTAKLKIVTGSDDNMVRVFEVDRSDLA